MSSIWATFKRDPLQPVRDYIQNYGIVGVGLFLEGYVIFSISNISTLFKKTYYECWSSFQTCNRVRFPRPCLHFTALSSSCALNAVCCQLHTGLQASTHSKEGSMHRALIQLDCACRHGRRRPPTCSWWAS